MLENGNQIWIDPWLQQEVMSLWIDMRLERGQSFVFPRSNECTCPSFSKTWDLGGNIAIIAIRPSFRFGARQQNLIDFNFPGASQRNLNGSIVFGNGGKSKERRYTDLAEIWGVTRNELADCALISEPRCKKNVTATRRLSLTTEPRNQWSEWTVELQTRYGWWEEQHNRNKHSGLYLISFERFYTRRRGKTLCNTAPTFNSFIWRAKFKNLINSLSLPFLLFRKLVSLSWKWY